MGHDKANFSAMQFYVERQKLLLLEPHQRFIVGTDTSQSGAHYQFIKRHLWCSNRFSSPWLWGLFTLCIIGDAPDESAPRQPENRTHKFCCTFLPFAITHESRAMIMRLDCIMCNIFASFLLFLDILPLHLLDSPYFSHSLCGFQADLISIPGNYKIEEEEHSTMLIFSVQQVSHTHTVMGPGKTLSFSALQPTPRATLWPNKVY